VGDPALNIRTAITLETIRDDVGTQAGDKLPQPMVMLR
jgi:hypothetical protein